MKVVYIEPNKEAVIKEIEPGLKSMQDIVNGYIQVIYPFNDPVAIVCNNDGKMLGLELNRGLTDDNGELYDIIAGKFFICLARPKSEDLEGLTDELANKYLKMFKEPELFIMVNGKLIALKKSKTF